jgi:hypothetical protein
MLGLGIGIVGTVAVANFAQEARDHGLGAWGWVASALAGLNALGALALVLGVFPA